MQCISPAVPLAAKFVHDVLKRGSSYTCMPNLIFLPTEVNWTIFGDRQTHRPTLPKEYPSTSSSRDGQKWPL